MLDQGGDVPSKEQRGQLRAARGRTQTPLFALLKTLGLPAYHAITKCNLQTSIHPL